MARTALTKKSISIEGVPELAAKISDLVEEVTVREGVFDVLMTAGRVARDEIRDGAPVRSGVTRDSVFAARGVPAKFRKGPSVVVGINFKKAPQALWYEYGTVHQPARPFFRPAINAVRPSLARVIADGFRRVIQGAARG